MQASNYWKSFKLHGRVFFSCSCCVDILCEHHATCIKISANKYANDFSTPCKPKQSNMVVTIDCLCDMAAFSSNVTWQLIQHTLLRNVQIKEHLDTDPNAYCSIAVWYSFDF